MRDKQHGQPIFLGEVSEQVENLRLNGHVERRDGLVGHNKLRACRERAADGNTLSLPARELVRILAHKRACQTHIIHELANRLF